MTGSRFRHHLFPTWTSSPSRHRAPSSLTPARLARSFSAAQFYLAVCACRGGGKRSAKPSSSLPKERNAAHPPPTPPHHPESRRRCAICPSLPRSAPSNCYCWGSPRPAALTATTASGDHRQEEPGLSGHTFDLVISLDARKITTLAVLLSKRVMLFFTTVSMAFRMITR